MSAASELEAHIEGFVAAHVAGDARNVLSRFPGVRIYDAPLVGYVAAQDPIFEQFKTVIGSFHWTPAEAFALSGGQAAPEELTVVSIILPFTAEIVDSNAAQESEPSPQWTLARLEGEEYRDAVLAELVAELESRGVEAVAPDLRKEFAWRDDEHVGFTTQWSQRHVAYAAGLGSFGLCRGLITPRGKAMRCGSVVLRARVGPQPVQRPGLHDACPAFGDGSCRACERRCPAGAVGEGPQFKMACAAFQREMHARLTEKYGFKTIGCGLCQTGVPCARTDKVGRGGRG